LVFSHFFCTFATNFNLNMVDLSQLHIEGEPQECFEIRNKIVTTFSDLIFQEEGHRYTLNGKELISVTRIAHDYRQPFDEIAQSEAYAAKNGETPEYWRKQWHYNSFRATTTGTLVHAFGESLGWLRNGHPELITEECLCKYHKETESLVPTRHKENAVIKFMNDLPSSYHLILNEARVYSGLNEDKDKNPPTQFCGTFDLLYWYDGDGDPSKQGLIIMDYKTNSKLENSYARNFGKMCLPPFQEMYDEDLSSYTIQLSAYQIPLEDIGLRVLGRKVIWLKDDETYEKFDLPDITGILRKTI